MTKLKLYDFPLSGNCYKIRLLLSLLDVDYESIAVDLAAGETQTEAFKKLNPRGLVPVLADGDTVIWDSMAILSYLARQYGDESWFPQDPLAQARVMQWLALSENELLYGLARARAIFLFKRPFDLEQCQADAHIGLATMEQHLATQTWLVAEAITIADIACYPYVSVAHEGEVSLETYPNVRRWMEQLEVLPRYKAMLDF
ncbi:MAG TPA: glutathione S-transferase family protein [Leucothrix mucor]|nr:glutathione S-transferase family protein [Leucothrix mucor]